MAAFGEDFSGGLGRRLFQSRNSKGLWASIGIAVALLVVNLFLQFGLGSLSAVFVFGGSMADPQAVSQGVLLAMFPASLAVAVVAWNFARLGGGRPAEVLNLQMPRLGSLGFAAVIVGFMFSLLVAFAIIGLVLSLFGIDPRSGGLVENTMAELADQPGAYLLLLPSLVLGAPIAEELIFRGQLFTALSNTRLGFAGASVITALGWSLLHYTGNWLLVLFIFIMGLGFGYLLYRFGSLWVTLACHACWNAMSSMVILGGYAQ